MIFPADECGAISLGGERTAFVFANVCSVCFVFYWAACAAHFEYYESPAATAVLIAHSVQSLPLNISSVNPSGSGLDQHSRPHFRHIVSFQLLSLGSGTFFLRGIVMYPPLSVGFLGSILTIFFLSPLLTPGTAKKLLCMPLQEQFPSGQFLNRPLFYSPKSGFSELMFSNHIPRLRTSNHILCISQCHHCGIHKSVLHILGNMKYRLCLLFRI